MADPNTQTTTESPPLEATIAVKETPVLSADKNESTNTIPAPEPVTGVNTALGGGEGTGINFIRDQRKKLDVHLNQDKKIARYSAYGVIAFMFALTVVVVIYYLLVLQQRRIEESVTDVSSRLSSMSSLEKEYVVYAKKVKLLFTLDAARETKREATTFFYSLVPPENLLREVRTDDVDQKDTITFRVQSPDVFTLLRLLQNFADKSVYDRGYILQTEQLSRSPDGSYSIEGSMNYALANAKTKGKTQ